MDASDGRSKARRTLATDSADPAAGSMALYLRVKGTLKEHILDGEYGVGDQLPSEYRLRAAFGVSRDTIRQALQALQDEQLIESIQGKGHFVRRPKAVQNLARLEGLGEAVSASGLEVRSRVIGARECGADKRVAEALKVAPGGAVVELTRVRCINRRPASLDISYFPLAIGRPLLDADLATRDVFDILERDFGIELRAADITIEVGHATDEVVRHLGIAPGAPVLHIERLTCALDGNPIDFEFIFARGDSYQFRVRALRF